MKQHVLNEKKYRLYRRILEIVKRILGIVWLIIKIIRDFFAI